MKWYEVIEDLGDGSTATRRFREEGEARGYINYNIEYCWPCECRPVLVDTDSPHFFYKDLS